MRTNSLVALIYTPALVLACSPATPGLPVQTAANLGAPVEAPAAAADTGPKPADAPAENAPPSPTGCWVGKGGMMIPLGHVFAYRDVTLARSGTDGDTVMDLHYDAVHRLHVEIASQGGYEVAKLRMATDDGFTELRGVAHTSGASWTVNAAADDQRRIHMTGFAGADGTLTVITFAEGQKQIDTLTPAAQSDCNVQVADGDEATPA